MSARRRSTFRSTPAGVGLRLSYLWLSCFCLSCFCLLCASAFGEAERGQRGLWLEQDGRVLQSEASDRLFVPGSVLKLVVVAAALHHLGPDDQIVTELAADGAVRDGILDGNLVLRAAGDPTWSERFPSETALSAVDELARQVAAGGVRRVAGDLVVDLRRFSGRTYPVSRPISESAFAYAAPTSAVAVDENRLWVEIAPGRQIGDAARISVPEPWQVINRTRTVGPERHEKGTVEFLPVWGTKTLLLRGEYPISEPSYRVPVAVPWPEWLAAEALRRALRAGGVDVEGEIRLEEASASSVNTSPGTVLAGTVLAGTVLARVQSPPLADRIEPILKDSHNWHAEMLLLRLAESVEGSGRLDTGLEVERRFLTEVVGIDESAFVLDDASGLSPYNLVRPEAVAALLRWVWHQPWRDTFMRALATPRDGTLASWGGLPPLQAKTGTVRQAMGLAGYLPRQGAPPKIFVIFLNQREADRGILRSEIRAQVRAWAAN